MQDWIRENKTPITIVISAVAGTAAVVGVILISINSIHHRLDAQDRYITQRFEAQDRSITQRFEAQDRSITQRFEAQDRSITQRFEAMDKAINQHFNAVGHRFDNTDERLDRLTDEVSELRKLTVGISERVSRNEGQIDVIKQQLQTADAPAP